MKWTLNLGKVSGIKISVHWTFILLLFWFVMISWKAGHDVTQSFWSLIFILSIFVCVVLHELGHALTAKRYGCKTQDITLLPIGGIARMEKLPEQPAQELAVALAGPFVNVLIALLLLPLIRQHLNSGGLDVVTPTINNTNFLLNLFLVNVSLAVFNLLPAFPMDGGRVLRALLSFWIDRVKATRIAGSIGQLMAIGFILLGLFYNPFLVFIGLFIILGAQTEMAYTESKSLLSGYTVHDAMMTEFSLLKEDDPLSKAVQFILNGQNQDFLVMDDQQRITGSLNRNQIIKVLTTRNDTIPVAQVMNKNIHPMEPDASLDDVFQILQKNESSIVPIMNRQKLLGAINLENVMEFIMIKKAIAAKKIQTQV